MRACCQLCVEVQHLCPLEGMQEIERGGVTERCVQPDGIVAAGPAMERSPIKGRLPSTGSRPTRRLALVMSTLHKSQLVEAMKSCTTNPSYLKSVFSTGNQI